MLRILLKLTDDRLKQARLVLAALFYGVALGGTLAAMVFLVRL
jgi:hypothetical protein